MLSKLAFLLLAAAWAASVTPVAKAPNYTCTDDKGLTFKIWMSPDGNRIQIAPKGGVAKEFPLSAENILLRFRTPEDERVYNVWNPAAPDAFALTDLSTEFTLHYARSGGSTQIYVGLVYEDRDRSGLNCRASGYAVEVKADETSLGLRHGNLLREYTEFRSINGTLEPEGIIGIAGILTRAFTSSTLKGKESKTEFLKLAANPIKNIDPRSLDKITGRLTPPVAEFWKQLLKEIQYDIYPYVNRYTTWIVSGAKRKPTRDLTSIAAGFNEFASSSSVRDKDVLAFFHAEVLPVVRELADVEVSQIRGLVDPKAEKFFIDTWAKAVGKKTLADFAEIERMALDIETLAKAKDFEPQRVQRKIESFLSSSMAADPEAREAFVMGVSPVLKSMSARQREDLLPWFEDPTQKQFLQLLLK